MTYKSLPDTREDDSFEAKLKQLLSVDDYVYSLYSTHEDPISRKISEEDREEIIQESIKVGQNLANEMLLKDPNQSVADRIKANGIELIREESQGKMDFVYFGTYETDGPITLFKGNISKSEQLLKKQKIDWLSVEEISEIVLAHELFHFYEDQYPDMYTNTKEIKLWKIGPLKHRSKLICPSEIAAMSFTKQLLNLDFNPGAINYLLYSSIDKEAGKNFFKRITELDKKIS